MKQGPTVPPGVHQGPVGSPQGSRGPVGTPEGPVWVRTSIVHRYGTVKRPVEPCRVPSFQILILKETGRNPIWPDEPRRITRLSRIGVRLIYGPIRDHTGP